jgi:hypothetical protein
MRECPHFLQFSCRRGSTATLKVLAVFFRNLKQMLVKKFYRGMDVTLGSVRAVRDALTNSLSWGLQGATYQLYYPSEEVTSHAISEVESIIRDRGNPSRIKVRFTSQAGRTLIVDGTDPSRVIVEINNLNKPPSEVLGMIERALQVVPLDELPVPRQAASVFVAHSFDQEGHHCANEVSRFLSLNGLRVYSGRVFAAKKLSEKVETHLARHDVVVAILTPTDDNTWLTQEMTAAATLKKPLFILKQDNANLKEGLLGDYAYIPFPQGQITRTFIPMLEGLAEIRGIDVTDRGIGMQPVN